MPALPALEHLFSSVERGLFARQGRGFQTVAVSEPLIGTEDLGVLEEAAFYAVSRERRGRRDFPVKETFFSLPSGRFAVGRTVYLGADALGREGNYLTRHLILSRNDLLALEANPFALLDAPELTQATPEIIPRQLPPLLLDLRPTHSVVGTEDGTAPALLANLVAAVLDGGEKTVLLIGDEIASRRLLRELFALLALEERLRLTFSSHFYESHHLRPRFALAAVGTGSEAPAQWQDYLTFDLSAGDLLSTRPQRSAYATWLAGCVEARDWEAVTAFNDLLDRLRGQQRNPVRGFLPESPEAGTALWERMGARAAPELIGRPRLAQACLHRLSAPRPLATALLAAAGPSELGGPEAPREVVAGLLSALKAAVTGKEWNEWVERWGGDPAFNSGERKGGSWWKRWGK